VGEFIQHVSRMNHLQVGMAGPEIRADYDAVNRVLAKVFPRWTRDLADGTRVFYWDPMRIVSAELTGLGMKPQWLKPSTDFDRVFVFGEFSRKLLIDAGYPDDKIVVAGQPLFDNILRQRGDLTRRAEIAAHIGVTPGEPFLLVNIEPSLEHDYATAEDHWRNFHEVLRACTGHGAAIVLSLHPLCEVENYRFAENQYGCRISTRFSIHELYPDCTVSVSFVCSTNVLALDFCRPLVIYDFQRMLDRDALTDQLYKLPGALVGRSEPELRSHISAALMQPARELSTAMAGGSCERIALHVVAAASADDRRTFGCGMSRAQ